MLTVALLLVLMAVSLVALDLLIQYIYPKHANPRVMWYDSWLPGIVFSSLFAAFLIIVVS